MRKGWMQMYTTVTLVKVEDNRPVTRASDPDFYFALQRGVLLSLKEAGELTHMQYRYAEEALRQQRSASRRTRTGGIAT